MQLRSGIAVVWYRLAAVARIQSLAWEPPYVTGVAQKRKKKKKKKKDFLRMICILLWSYSGH